MVKVAVCTLLNDCFLFIQTVWYHSMNLVSTIHVWRPVQLTSLETTLLGSVNHVSIKLELLCHLAKSGFVHSLHKKQCPVSCSSPSTEPKAAGLKVFVFLDGSV